MFAYEVPEQLEVQLCANGVQPAQEVVLSLNTEYDNTGQPLPDHEEPDYKVWEYFDEEGDARGTLLAVSGATPVWHIDRNAGEGQYTELVQARAGRGLLSIVRADGYREFHIVDATKRPDQEIELRAGDTFQYRCTSIGELVMAGVNPGPAFEEGFERRIEQPVMAAVQ